MAVPTQGLAVSESATELAAYQQRAASEADKGLADRIREWLARMTPRTQAAYGGELRRFAYWLGTDNIAVAIDALCHAARLDTAPKPTLRMIERYRDSLYGDGTGRKSSSVNRSVAALNSCLAMCHKAGIGPGPQKVDPAPSNVVAGTRKGPGRDDVAAMLLALRKRNSADGIRDLAIVSLLVRGALRRCELVGLDLDDFDPVGGRVRILGKGRRAKEWSPIAARTVEAISAWLRLRSEIAAADETALFVSLSNGSRGKRISGHAVADLVAKAATEAEIGRVRPHGLRHSGVTAVLQSSKDIRVASHFARHADVSTTIRAYDDSKSEAQRSAADLLDSLF